jgi:hypothetical protein
MWTLMTELLVWGVLFLLAFSFMGIWGYAAVEEWRHNTGQPLNDFADMKRAFRMGGLINFLDGRRYFAVTAMRSFAEGRANAAEREAIALMMRNAISKAFHKTDNRSANDVNHMMQTLAAAAPPWEAEFLARVCHSKLEGWVRGRAIERLARLRSSDLLEFLLDLADDPPVADAAAAAIARLGPRKVTGAAISRLEHMLGETQNSWAPSAAARALISLGQGSNPILTGHYARFDPWTAFSVRVKAAEIDAPVLIERLFAAGIVGDDRRKLLKPAMVAKMRKALNAGDGFQAVEAFLKRMKAVYDFDTEWDPVPDYGMLLNKLSRIAAPRITITDVDVTMAGEACREVNCKIANHPARFMPEFMGDWTDLEAVLGGLNAALAAAGRLERFASLTTGDQTACVILGLEQGLASLVETLGLPLDANANAALAIGIGAEDHAAELVKAEHPTVKIMRG